METYLNLMLLRFGLLTGVLVVLALVVFAVALTLKRRGRLDHARRLAEPAARAAGRALARRLEGGPARTRHRDGRLGGQLNNRLHNRLHNRLGDRLDGPR